MPALIRDTSPPGASAAVRVPTIVFVACALVLSAACADSDAVPLDGATSAVERDDARVGDNPRADASAAGDAGEPGQDADDEEPADAGQEPDADQTGEDAGEDAGGDELDAGGTSGDAGDSDDAQQPAPDASADAQTDASAGDAQTDAAAPDAGCAAAQPADACGVCGGDGSSCRHPLAGRYAARTQFYALQQASFGDTPLEVISNGNLLSLVEISPEGVATEHYCFLELASPDGLFVWSTPSTVEEIPDTSVALEQRGDRFVRPLALHRAHFGWSPQGAPADCVTGQTHASGCLCGAPDALPSDEDDCRVRDIDDDGVPGGAMYLDVERAADPSATSTQLKLNVVALLNLEWSLHPPNGAQIIGDIAGGLDQAVLSLQGDLAEGVGELDNRMCDSALGHVELLRGDDFTCASLLTGRAEDPVAYGIFDPVYDEETPSVEACGATPGS